MRHYRIFDTLQPVCPRIKDISFFFFLNIRILSTFLAEAQKNRKFPLPVFQFLIDDLQCNSLRLQLLKCFLHLRQKFEHQIRLLIP